MTINLGGLSASCVWLLAGLTLAACGDEGGRPRHLDHPNVLHGSGGSSGAGGSGSDTGGGSSAGGSGGQDDEDLDAGTGGYQIGTDWDGNTRPTAENVRGVDAAAGEDERGTPSDAGTDGG